MPHENEKQFFRQAFSLLDELNNTNWCQVYCELESRSKNKTGQINWNLIPGLIQNSHQGRGYKKAVQRVAHCLSNIAITLDIQQGLADDVARRITDLCQSAKRIFERHLQILQKHVARQNGYPGHLKACGVWIEAWATLEGARLRFDSQRQSHETKNNPDISNYPMVANGESAAMKIELTEQTLTLDPIDNSNSGNIAISRTGQGECIYANVGLEFDQIKTGQEECIYANVGPNIPISGTGQGECIYANVGVKIHSDPEVGEVGSTVRRNRGNDGCCLKFRCFMILVLLMIVGYALGKLIVSLFRLN